MDELENACHDGAGEGRWPFRKSTDEFIEELFRAYLQMKRISTRLNEGVNEGESQHGDMGISMIDESDGQHRSLPRSEVTINIDKRRSDDPKSSENVRVGLLLIYMVGNFEIEGIIWVGKGWITSPADQ